MEGHNTLLKPRSLIKDDSSGLFKAPKTYRDGFSTRSRHQAERVFWASYYIKSCKAKCRPVSASTMFLAF